MRNINQTFKIQDNAGNRFVIQAKSRQEAMIKAKKVAKGSVIYFL